MEAMKVFVNVPVAHADAVRAAIAGTGAGTIGNYTSCSFSYPGVGRFKPESGATPAIGTVGTLEAVEEERIEFVCRAEIIEAVVAAIKSVHPYEEPAIDAFPVKVF